LDGSFCCGTIYCLSFVCRGCYRAVVSVSVDQDDFDLKLKDANIAYPAVDYPFKVEFEASSTSSFDVYDKRNSVYGSRFNLGGDASGH